MENMDAGILRADEHLSVIDLDTCDAFTGELPDLRKGRAIKDPQPAVGGPDVHVRTGESQIGYEWLFRTGQLVEAISPYRDGRVAPAHADDIGIPFWYMTEYARSGPRIEIWKLPDDIQSFCTKKPR